MCMAMQNWKSFLMPYEQAVDEDAYIDCLQHLCASSQYFHGLRQFHLPYLIDALKRKRRYKEALQLMEEQHFPEIDTLRHLNPVFVG